jgi:hypothetical protein
MKPSFEEERGFYHGPQRRKTAVRRRFATAGRIALEAPFPKA